MFAKNWHLPKQKKTCKLPTINTRRSFYRNAHRQPHLVLVSPRWQQGRNLKLLHCCIANCNWINTNARSESFTECQWLLQKATWCLHILPTANCLVCLCPQQTRECVTLSAKVVCEKKERKVTSWLSWPARSNSFISSARTLIRSCRSI